MHIDLTDGEFERLLKVVYLGEMLMNDWVPEEKWNEEQRTAADLLCMLCDRAERTPAEHLVMPHPEDGAMIPSDSMRIETDPYVRSYDDEVFWEELVRRLARRDLEEEYGREEAETMNDARYFASEEPLLKYYGEEVESHGVDRLRIKED